MQVLWPSLDALGIGAGELVQGNADALATAIAMDAKVLCLHPGSLVSSVNLCKLNLSSFTVLGQLFYEVIMRIEQGNEYRTFNSAWHILSAQ